MADKFGDQLSKIQEINEALRAQEEAENKLDSTFNNRMKILNNIADAQDDIAELAKTQKDITAEINDLNKKGHTELAKRYAKEQGLAKERLKQLRTQKLANQAMAGADKITGGMASKLKENVNSMKGMGKGAIAASLSMGLVVGAVALLVKALSFSSELTDKLGASFGVVGAQSSQFKTDMQDASVDVISLGKGMTDVVSVVEKLSSEFGIAFETSANLAEQILDTAVATGLSTDEATKLFGTLMTIADLTADQAESLTESAYQLAAQNGVAPVTVMKDIAESSETIAKFGADNLESITKAAVQARKLGTNLSAVEKAAEGFLDFQSSLTAEFEAEILLGRDLELSRARQFAVVGDLDGVLNEIVKNVGTEAELNKLNVIERKSLAKALQMDVQQLNKIVRLQDKSVVQQKNFADLAGKDGLSALTSIKNEISEIGAFILLKLGQPLEKALKEFQKNFFTDENIEKAKTFIENFANTMVKVAKAVVDIGKFFKGTADFFQSAADNSLIYQGIIKPLLVNDFNSSGGSHLVVTPTGKMLKTNPRDTVFGTTTPVNDFVSGPAGSMGTSNRETNGLLNKIIEQNETMITHLSKNPQRIGDEIRGM